MSWELLTTLVGGVATLAIFSFLIKENAWYRFFEHLFIGISAGLGILLSVRDFIYPLLIVPLCGLDIVTFPDGTVAEPYQPRVLLYLIPMLFGLTVYFIYSKRHGWIAKLSIGFLLGVSSGAELESFVNAIFPQVLSSFKPLLVLGAEGTSIDWGESLSNMVFLLSLTSVMVYFLFSFKAETRALQATRLVGRSVMMVCFGAYFGSTVMARMALVVERLQFLTGEWVGAVGQVLGV